MYKKSIFSVIGVFVLGLACVPFLSHAVTLTRQLDVGMSGADVSSVQTYLSADPSLYPEGLVTGYFGSLTSRAVGRFQTANGIASVGRVGPVTLVALNAKMDGGSTVGYDRTAPVIGPVSVSTSNGSATLSWNTSEAAASIIYFSSNPIPMTEAGPGSAVTIGGTASAVHADLSVAHVATISGLQSNTSYYYVLYVRDGSGNETVTVPATFRTN